MSKSQDVPMLGGCCICLDERGWDENPLVYCDGQGCSIAVHQACYGIVSVPSGPWYCRCCEVYGKAVQLPCKLCPFVGGGLKKIDHDNQWAHVVCGLYIPEVEFGNVSSMEPILIKKLPEDRFKKKCYVCEENDRREKSVGACMDCAKSGCKLSFHVTCAQMTGLLCEIAGASNTTKYCGFCKHHEYKHKRLNSFKNLACAKVYKLPTCKFDNATMEGTTNVENSNNTIATVDNVTTVDDIRLEQEAIAKTADKEIELKQTSNQNSISTSEDGIQDPLGSVCSSSTSLASLANVASFALEKETLKSIEVNNVNMPSLQIDNKKKKKKRLGKQTKPDDNKLNKIVKVKKSKISHINEIPQEEKNALSSVSNLETRGYAFAPKHSVVSLSEFGDSSLEPSHPSDIGETKPTPLTNCNDVDGLTAIEQLNEKQEADLMHFFQKHGTSSTIAQLVQVLHALKEENKQIVGAVEKMTHRRDQLLAIKARLSVPLRTKFP